MKYAFKTKIAIPEVAKKLRRTTRVIGVDGSKEKGNILRRYVPRDEVEHILSVLPQDVAKANKWLFISEIGQVAPHVHTEEECVINMYIEASKARTVFYDGEVAEAKDAPLKIGDKYFFVDEALLVEAESFEAESGDVWVINTSQPHSVVADDARNERWALQIYLSIPFDSAIKYLTDNGL